MGVGMREGRWEPVNVAGDERVLAHIPPALPPSPLNLERLLTTLGHADRALGRLDGLTRMIPEISLFLYMYVRKEAILSSQIEGTQSSLSDLLLYELSEEPGVPMDDVAEVSNYVAALEHGLRRIREGFPISTRLFCEMHEILLRKARGEQADLGEFRRSQNWIGGSRPGNALYVPPPAHYIDACMSDLEKFIHNDQNDLHVLIKAGLTHVQFESIHPFLDGNGRLGRLLVTLILCTEGVLREPLLYLSLYFKHHRQSYYEMLQGVRTEGDWENWLCFFLEAIRSTAQQAAETAQQVIEQFEKDRKRISALGSSGNSALRLHETFQRNPLLSVSRAHEFLNVTKPTINTAMRQLEDLGIVREVTGRKRDRVFAYTEFLRILSQGTEPIEP